ncbi:keratin, type I cytoskeletal 9-like [Acipenser ruthenus]|uniref:keratin, type I cytoskeletal 9-like n=1 Tax=Acipenser ruthenus TaxID=7906 RepID=UPI0027415144|nr:keratin, type I cytoskeletal 9-like [Acipenser ruthenus]
MHTGAGHFATYTPPCAQHTWPQRPPPPLNTQQSRPKSRAGKGGFSGPMSGNAISSPAGSGTADSMLVPSCSEKAAGAGGPPTSPFFVAGSSLLWGSGHKNSCSETAAGESGLQTSSPFFVAGSSPFWGSGHRTPCGGTGSRGSSCSSAPGGGGSRGSSSSSAPGGGGGRGSSCSSAPSGGSGGGGGGRGSSSAPGGAGSLRCGGWAGARHAAFSSMNRGCWGTPASCPSPPQKFSGGWACNSSPSGSWG